MVGLGALGTCVWRDGVFGRCVAWMERWWFSREGIYGMYVCGWINGFINIHTHSLAVLEVEMGMEMYPSG